MSVIFVFLTIHKDSSDKKHIVEMVRKTESSGKIKKQFQNTFHSDNYLSIYVYNDKNLVDTMKIEHPLYKHFEYLDENNSLTAKDTVLDKADFFFRIQKQGHSNEIRIFETLKNKPRKEISIIKL